MTQTTTNTRLDVTIARISHLRWELDLEAAVLGARNTIHMPQYQDCELGIWLHSRGQRQIGNRTLLAELIEWHRRFHQAGESICSQALPKQNPAAPLPSTVEEQLKELRHASHHIISMLTQAELDHYGNSPISELPTHPWSRLLGFLFHGPRLAASEKAGILEVNQARLLHLRWANHLPETFRNRGRRISLESVELCPLSVWIHGTGLKRFGQMPELIRCDQAHKAFHARAEEILSNLRMRRDQHADRAYADVLKLSQEIIYLLSVIEYRLLGDAAIRRFSSLIP
ncbi:MAG: CZB domain-containing protein [Magnetococcales bacterium]|nr:CZB domain-containing protein [Magnetococcales bacterium]